MFVFSNANLQSDCLSMVNHFMPFLEPGAISRFRLFFAVHFMLCISASVILSVYMCVFDLKTILCPKVSQLEEKLNSFSFN